MDFLSCFMFFLFLLLWFCVLDLLLLCFFLQCFGFSVVSEFAAMFSIYCCVSDLLLCL